MGDTGQGTSNGGGGGTSRVNAALVNISNMQALAQKSGTQADMALAVELKRAMSASVDSNQQDTNTQRFFNAIGWCDKKPVTVKDEDALEVEKFQNKVYGQYFYHTDDTYRSITDAKVFANQYMNGRQYLSTGIHGDGTYWSNSSRDSWDYGYDSKAYQIKGMLNGNAKVIKETTLARQIRAFNRTHPKAAQAINNMGYSSRTMSVYAALFGYNVIQSKQGGCDYLTVLDRSATTVAKAGFYRSQRRSPGVSVWKHT